VKHEDSDAATGIEKRQNTDLYRRYTNVLP
jgi:hypothetical protein